jgi:hypothetical protein
MRHEPLARAFTIWQILDADAAVNVTVGGNWLIPLTTKGAAGGRKMLTVTSWRRHCLIVNASTCP